MSEINCTILLGVQVEALEGRAVLAETLIELRNYFPILAISSVFRSQKIKNGTAGDVLVVVVKSESASNSADTCAKAISIEKFVHQKHPLREVKVFLLTFGEEVAMSPQLVLPHPELVQFEGFLAASSELWGRYKHPVLQSSLEEISIKQSVKSAEFVFQGKTLLTDKQKLSLFSE